MALIPGTTDMSVPESGERPASGSAFSTTCYKKADIINDIVKNNEKACLMIIEIPAGKGRGAYIDNLSKFKGKEYEFLIKRKARFRVSSIKYTEEGVIARMRMICED
ncbi:MAG: hypothetical protein K5838_08910 [Elusimicrobiales bacterium]|nr:hypothetical protein [Elusimicrobiales bacterium]